MQIRRFQVFTLFAAFACVALILPGTTLAAKTKFPPKNPAFTIELPSGWRSGFDKKGTFNSQPPGDDTYNFSILDLNGITSSKELRAALPELAKSAGLKKFKVGEVEETGSDTMQFLEVEGHGESDGLPMTVVVTGFEAEKGRFFALLGVAAGQSEKKYARDYEALAASIEPVKGSPGKAGESSPDLPIADTTLSWSSKTGDVSVYFQPNRKCTINFKGNEGRYPKADANSKSTKGYDVTQLSGGKWRVRIHLDEPQDITFRVTKANPSAEAGQAAIAAVGTNDGDPYQHGEEGELKFVRGKQSGPPE
jgi:hypothetical protein